MKIVIFGLGITGLVNYATYWNHRDTVVAYGEDPKEVLQVTRYPNPAWEVSLRKILSKTKAKKIITSKLEDLEGGNLFLFCEEPVYQKDGSLDVSSLEKDLMIAQQHCSKDDVYFVLRTLLPLGYTVKLRLRLPSSIHLIVAPSFLSSLPYSEEINPDRIVLGVEKEEDADAVIALRKREIQNHGVPVFVMDYASAELLPFVSLTFLRAKQNYANAVAMLCERYGADASKVLPSLGSDHRIGWSLLRVNGGYGEDHVNQALREIQNQFEPAGQILEANQKRIDSFLETIRIAFNGNLQGKTIAIAGWPANEGNAKAAVAWWYAEKLVAAGANVVAYEPKETRPLDQVAFVRFAETFRAALASADALLILAPEDCFKQLSEERLLQAMPGRWIFDACQLYDSSYFHEFHYVAAGEKPSTIEMA